MATKTLILALLLFGCSQKPIYTITARVTEIKPASGGFWVYFKNSYREYKTYQTSIPDSVKVGKVLNLPVIYRIR